IGTLADFLASAEPKRNFDALTESVRKGGTSVAQVFFFKQKTAYEIAHIDLLIGDKDGPVGTAFATALADQKHGHSNLLAVLTPNLLCKPVTVLITKVTIKGATQAVQMFGPAQAAVAKAVTDCVASVDIPK